MVITGSRPNMRYIKKSKRTVEASGIEVMFSPGLLRCIRDGVVNFKDGEFMEPEVRAEELRWALRVNPDLIICATGGYGNARIIPLLDFREIKDANIPVMGFSDCTSLVNLWACLGVPAYIGPCFEEYEFIIPALKFIEKSNSILIASPLLKFLNFEEDILRLNGLLGGNLTSFTALTGIREFTELLPKIDAFIFEDIYPDYGKKGAIYAFESTLDIVEASGCLKKVVLFGSISGVRSLTTLISKRIRTKAVLRLPFGHYSFKSFMPILVGRETEVEICKKEKTVKIFRKGEKL